MDTCTALERLALFSHLSPASRLALAAVARVVEYDDAQPIMLEGEEK